MLQIIKMEADRWIQAGAARLRALADSVVFYVCSCFNQMFLAFRKKKKKNQMFLAPAWPANLVT
jgi:Ni,Fe-hydrogenase I cytochrome b subunit